MGCSGQKDRHITAAPGSPAASCSTAAPSRFAAAAVQAGVASFATATAASSGGGSAPLGGGCHAAAPLGDASDGCATAASASAGGADSMLHLLARNTSYQLQVKALPMLMAGP